MFHIAARLLCLLAILALPPAAMAEKVALRAANGRFVRAADDGMIHADSFVPADRQLFEWVSRGPHEVALKGLGGRCLMPDPGDGHTPRLALAATPPTALETFELVPVAANRFLLRPQGFRASLVFAPAVQGPVDPKLPAGPARCETVEIYRVGELPAMLQTTIPAVVDALAAKELVGKQYDNTQKHETEKYLDLPAPTLKDLTRMKRHKVIDITEEYHIQAQLDGKADIRMPTMLLLSNHAEGGPGLILLSIAARLPVRGRVEGKVPDVAKVSTGYRLTVDLSAVVEVAVRHAGHDVVFDPPTVNDLHVSVARMEFSNDILEAARHAIRRVVNRELAHNEGRIRESREPRRAEGDVVARGPYPAAGISATDLSRQANNRPA